MKFENDVDDIVLVAVCRIDDLQTTDRLVPPKDTVSCNWLDKWTPEEMRDTTPR